MEVAAALAPADPSQPPGPVVAEEATFSQPEGTADWISHLGRLADWPLNDILSEGPPQTLRKVPFPFQGAYGTILGDLLHKRRLAALGGHMETMALTEKALLLLPRLLLKAPPPAGKQTPPARAAHESKQFTWKRFESFFRGDWQALLQPETGEDRSRRHAALESQRLTASRVMAAIKSGNYSKAVQQLTTLGVAPPNADTQRKVVELLRPKGAGPPPSATSTSTSTGTTAKPVTVREVGRFLFRTPKGGGKDALGWCYEHLTPIRNNKQMLEDFTAFINDFLTGSLALETVWALTHQVVTPLVKGTKGKLRPLACAATFRRTAYGVLTRSRSKDLAKIFGRSQYAVGRKAALECLARDLRAAIEQCDDAAVLQIDCNSAFNHVDREKVWQLWEQHDPSLLQQFSQALREPARNLVRSNDGTFIVVESFDGLTQGCPSSPGNFAIAVRYVEERWRSLLTESIGETAAKTAKLFAYLDDITVVATKHQLEECFLCLKKALAEVGLSVNETKCAVWTSDQSELPGESVNAIWHESDHDGFVLAGCPSFFEDKSEYAQVPIPIGNEEFVTNFLAKREVATKELISRIVELPLHTASTEPTVQAACGLIRSSVPQKNSHLLRVLPPHITQDFASNIDEATANATETILGLPQLERWQREALFVPTARGGWGIPSLALQRHTAFLGGALAAPCSEEESSNISSSGLLAISTHGRLVLEAVQALHSDHNVDARVVLNAAEADLVRGGIEGVQAALQKQVTKKTVHAHRQGLTANQRHWLDAASNQDADGRMQAPGASEWISAKPTTKQFSFHDIHLKLCARLRFQIPIAGPGTSCLSTPSSTNAQCGAPVDALGWHTQVCSRAGMSHRHDQIADIFHNICKEAGLQSQLKQIATEFPVDETARRVSDVRCSGCDGDLPVHYDVVVACSAQMRSGIRSVAQAGVLVEREERRKKSEWKAQSLAGCPARLVPLAFESQGRAGAETAAELLRLARIRSARLADAPDQADALIRSALVRWRKQLSVTLQRANATLALTSLGLRGVAPAAVWEDS